MKIIREGDLKRLEDLKCFECRECGCVFEANNTEYRRELAPRNEQFLVCRCPTCNKVVYLDDD